MSAMEWEITKSSDPMFSCGAAARQECFQGAGKTRCAEVDTRCAEADDASGAVLTCGHSPAEAIRKASTEQV